MASYEHTSQPSALKELLLFIAALTCLIAALTLLLSTPAHALMLQAEVATNEMQPIKAATTFAAEPAELPLPADSSTEPAAAPALKCKASNSFPLAFAGQWRCESLVVASAVREVVPGQRIVSHVNFVKSPAGSVSMAWAQDGWTSTLTSLRVKGDSLATASRVNQYMTGNWTATSRDRYVQVSKDQLVAESHIDQYVNGHYVGTYNTQSVLYRVEAPQTISLAK